MVYPERMFTDRRLQWFGHLKRMEENAWSSASRELVVSDDLAKEW